MPLCVITITDFKLDNAAQANNVADSFQTIANTLTPQEVMDLAALLKENPGIVQKAKQFRHLL